MFNQMVNHGDLDGTFGALAHETRRAILEQLSRGRSCVTELAEPHDMSLPAISKHLRVLEDAGLIVRSRVGREHRIAIQPEPLAAARDWMGLYARVWERQFDRLDALLRKDEEERERQ